MADRSTYEFRRRIVSAAVALAGLVSIAAAPAGAACPPVASPVRDLDVPRFYADAAGTVVDPDRLEAHAAAVAPLNAFVRRLTQDADKVLRRPHGSARTDLALCALDALALWARGNAWLGNMANKQAESQRKWDLAGVALGYLKLKPFARPQHRAAIEPWLIAFADRTFAAFDDPGRKRNNHWYWAGLGQGAVAVATGSEVHWQRARAVMLDAARDVAVDGTLAAELERRERALFYHAFAVMPLVVLAELAAARGEDWYGFAGGALHRLVGATHAGLRDPALFDARTGVVQERPFNPRAGWLQLYETRHPGRLVAPHPPVADGHRWIGGSAGLLHLALTAP